MNKICDLEHPIWTTLWSTQIFPKKSFSKKLNIVLEILLISYFFRPLKLNKMRQLKVTI